MKNASRPSGRLQIAFCAVLCGLFVAGMCISVPFIRAQEGQLPDFEDGEIRDIPVAAEQLFAPKWRLTDGFHVRGAFRDVARDAAAATVRVTANGRAVALGCIVSNDGWILTKASTLAGRVRCETAAGRKFRAEVVAKNGEYDVALLKIDADGLPVTPFAPAADPAVGSFVATVGPGGDPIAVGVVSVGPRAIPASPGVLGIQLVEENEPVVRKVFEDSGAARAGIQDGDMILSVEGELTQTREQVVNFVRRFNPGDRISVIVDRKGKVLELVATLSERFKALPPNRSQFQNDLGGKLSVRGFGFPRAFQHDTVLRPQDCGGPLVNLTGEVVGINIARSGRTESYALAPVTIETLARDLIAEAEQPEATQRTTTVAAP